MADNDHECDSDSDCVMGYCQSEIGYLGERYLDECMELMNDWSDYYDTVKKMRPLTEQEKYERFIRTGAEYSGPSPKDYFAAQHRQ